jgi:hypothetical protein
VIEATERIVRFGQDGGLVGIVTEPALLRPGAPACLLVNAGVVHRIGPHRINVKLARALAADGILSIRIDLSGLGDSDPVATPSGTGPQEVADLRAAMSFVEAAHGISRFITFGICSGAKNGYWLAQADERIVGLAMFDGYVYPTLRTHLLRRLVRARALGPGGLALKPVQWLRRRMSRSAPAAPVDRAPNGVGEAPKRRQFVATIDRLAERGTDLYLLFSGSFLDRYNYAGQSRDTLRGAKFADRVRDDYLPELDHTLISLAAQRQLIATLRAWALDIAGRSERGGSSQDGAATAA